MGHRFVAALLPTAGATAASREPSRTPPMVWLFTIAADDSPLRFPDEGDQPLYLSQMAVLVEDLSNRLVAQKLAIEQRPKRTLDCHDSFRIEAAPFESGGVDSDQASTVTRYHGVGWHVLGNFRA